MIPLLLLGLQTTSWQRLDHSYLHTLVTTKNFQYQTAGYIKPAVNYCQTAKQADSVGREAYRFLSALNEKSSIVAIRKAINECCLAKEECTTPEWRTKLSSEFDRYFRANPDKVKQLSRQDLCALLIIDIDLLRTANAKVSLKPIFDGFRNLIRKDFESPDVAVAYLKISNIMGSPTDPWKFEREVWALEVAAKNNLQGVTSLAVQANRLTAYGIRIRDPKQIDKSIALLQKMKDKMGIAEEKAGAVDRIKLMQKQKALLLKRIESEKKSGKKG